MERLNVRLLFERLHHCLQPYLELGMDGWLRLGKLERLGPHLLDGREPRDLLEPSAALCT